MSWTQSWDQQHFILRWIIFNAVLVNLASAYKYKQPNYSFGIIGINGIFSIKGIVFSMGVEWYFEWKNMPEWIAFQIRNNEMKEEENALRDTLGVGTN